MPHHKRQPYHKNPQIRRQLVERWRNEQVPESEPILESRIDPITGKSVIKIDPETGRVVGPKILAPEPEKVTQSKPLKVPTTKKSFFDKPRQLPFSSNPLMAEKQIKESFKKIPPQSESFVEPPVEPPVEPTTKSFVRPPVEPPTTLDVKALEVKPEFPTGTPPIKKPKESILTKQEDSKQLTIKQTAKESGLRYNETTHEIEPIPTKRAPGRGISKERAAREAAQLEFKIEEVFNTVKLSQIQALIEYAEHLFAGENIWGKAGNIVEVRDPKYIPNSKQTFYTKGGIERAKYHRLSSSFIFMKKYFRDNANWDESQLQVLRDYSREGAAELQRQYLVDLGFLQKVNPRWVDKYPRRGNFSSIRKPQFSKDSYMRQLFPIDGPDGVVEGTFPLTISDVIKMDSSLLSVIDQLPEIKKRLRRETIKTEVGIYDDPQKTNYGNKRFQVQSKYYEEEYDYLVTDKGRRYITERFKQLTSSEGFAGKKEPQILDKDFVLQPSNEGVSEGLPYSKDQIEQITSHLIGSREKGSESKRGGDTEVRYKTNQPGSFVDEMDLYTANETNIPFNADERKDVLTEMTNLRKSGIDSQLTNDEWRQLLEFKGEGLSLKEAYDKVLVENSWRREEAEIAKDNLPVKERPKPPYEGGKGKQRLPQEGSRTGMPIQEQPRTEVRPKGYGPAKAGSGGGKSVDMFNPQKPKKPLMSTGGFVAQ